MLTEHYLGLEIFYLSLLGLAGVAITWISAIVILRLFRGQR